ncbi:MAG: hypothetical protein IAI50_00155 [Candidatus Eremiobacteraeota bacterium]|nr:hypothetical protein [Candidatus Eremiobacteraeota bacterium]
MQSAALQHDPYLSMLPPGLRLANAARVGRTAFVNVAGVNAVAGNQTMVSDAASAVVLVWGGSGQLNAILFDGITADPTSLATDASENLYVANEGYGNIVVYPKPYTSIKLTLDDANEKTQGVAISQAGLVGVTNYLTSAYTPGSVYLYAKSATTACAIVSDPRWITYYYDAFDASGDLFIDGQDSFGNTLVGEVVGGCKAKSITTLTVNNTISTPGGVAVVRGNILIGDPSKQAIYAYAKPSRGTLGSPLATTTLAGATNPITFAMMADGRNLWTADLDSEFAMAGKYAYPGGAFQKSLNDNLLPVGVAVIPAAIP